ncbi:HAD family phosphatase [Streptomyces pactum]|uniref:HAD family phosphatase n=1 Tax=Streptomyces pactum TaxID=68249 RepID=A0ABS0NTX3_9ACTN|nr:HAD family phosphatase [Streptomyces pactum]MBH5338646.1 HAD family phosphatase [Streptomyces pactum]
MTHHRILDWTPEAIVFDCDGTLVDTERHWEQAREMVLADHGVTPDASFAQGAKGLHYTECGALMARVAGRPELTEVMTRQLLEAFRDLVAQEPAPTPGAVALVSAVSRFAPLAVASNCPADVVEFCLESVGVRRHFRHVVVPGEGIAPKPRPDVYAVAARRLGADPARALAVEDTGCGLRAAGRAGLRTIGVGRRPSMEDLTLADLWVGALDDPRLVAWARSRGTPRGATAGAGRPGRNGEAPAVPAPGGPSPDRGAGAGHNGASSRPDAVPGPASREVSETT